MPENGKVFADVLIPGTADYACNSIRAVCCLVNPVEAERSWQVAQAIANAPRITGRRTWYRVPYPDGTDSFISVAPGEYRTRRPDSGEDIVFELPEVSTENTLAQRLTALLAYCGAFEPFSSDTDTLARMVKAFSAKQQPDMSAFETADHLTRRGKGNRGELTEKLFEEGLLHNRIPLAEFSAAMALYQLQSIMGQWVEEKLDPASGAERSPAYREAIRSFYEYVYTLAATEHRSTLLGQLAEIGNINYADAGNSVKGALNNDSLIAFSRNLVIGAHQYLIALLVRRSAELAGMDAPFKYKMVQAEEGYACTQTGILSSLNFLFDHPDSEPKRISELLRAGIQETDILSGICSPFWPRFTKRFGKTLVASARVLAQARDGFEQGLRELHALEGEYSTLPSLEVHFERGWIDWALLNAYRRKDDKARVQSYAARITAQLLITYRASRVPLSG